MTASLPPAVRRLVACTVVSGFGTGLTLPFTLILLHEVRGIALSTTGLLLAVMGVVGLLVVPVGGALIDRVGPRIVLRGASALLTVGNVALAFATGPWTALPALVLIGAGLAPSFPAIGALLSGLVDGAVAQQRAFGVQFTALNASLGMGGVAAATLVDVQRPITFQVLFLGNALTCLLSALLVPPARARPPVDHHGDPAPPSYREVLADGTFRRVLGVALLLAVTGYAALDSGLPAYARVVGHVSPRVIALVFAVNTAVIVAGQLAVLRLLRGHRRSTALALCLLIWGASWSVLLMLPGLSGTGRAVVVLAFGGLFGLGETLMAPTLSPLVNTLATDRLRGRYNALQGATFSVAFVVSPAVSAALIGAGLGRAWLLAIVAGCLAGAVVAARLRRRLTPAQDGLVSGPGPAPDTLQAAVLSGAG